MSTVIATSVLPDSTANDTLTIGATGDSVVIGGNLLTMNTLQDTGGNTIFVSDGSGTLTSQNMPGALTLISTQTASGAASINFTTGLDSTYDIYTFKYININPATDGSKFEFQCSTDGGSSYNVTMTTTQWETYHDVADTTTNLYYVTGGDQAQGTAYQYLAQTLGSAAKESLDGQLYLFQPSSTTYVKNFYSQCQYYHGVGTGTSVEPFTAGYFNTTSAINAISFKMNTGNIDGIISMFGIKKS